MLCPKCGKSVPEKTRSCGSCGQTIDVDGDLTGNMYIPPGFMNAGAESFGQTEAGSGAAPSGFLARLKSFFKR